MRRLIRLAITAAVTAFQRGLPIAAQAGIVARGVD